MHSGKRHAVGSDTLETDARVRLSPTMTYTHSAPRRASIQRGALRVSIQGGALVQPLYRRTNHKNASATPPLGTTATSPYELQPILDGARQNAVSDRTTWRFAATPGESNARMRNRNPGTGAALPAQHA